MALFSRIISMNISHDIFLNVLYIAVKEFFTKHNKNRHLLGKKSVANISCIDF